jgi:hypothetical protein
MDIKNFIFPHNRCAADFSMQIFSITIKVRILDVEILKNPDPERFCPKNFNLDEAPQFPNIAFLILFFIYLFLVRFLTKQSRRLDS